MIRTYEPRVINSEPAGLSRLCRSDPPQPLVSFTCPSARCAPNAPALVSEHLSRSLRGVTNSGPQLEPAPLGAAILEGLPRAVSPGDTELVDRDGQHVLQTRSIAVATGGKVQLGKPREAISSPSITRPGLIRVQHEPRRLITMGVNLDMCGRKAASAGHIPVVLETQQGVWYAFEAQPNTRFLDREVAAR